MAPVRAIYEVVHHAVGFVCPGQHALNIKAGLESAAKIQADYKAVFGDGPKDKALLGEGVYREYGKAETGSMCRRASSRFITCLKNGVTRCNLRRNVCECTEAGATSSAPTDGPPCSTRAEAA
jgi:hypothetical protein